MPMRFVWAWADGRDPRDRKLLDNKSSMLAPQFRHNRKTTPITIQVSASDEFVRAMSRKNTFRDYLVCDALQERRNCAGGHPNSRLKTRLNAASDA